MSDPLDQAAVGSSDHGRNPSLARPIIVVNGTEGIEDSFSPTEHESTPELANPPQELERPQGPSWPLQESPEPVHPAQRTRTSAQGSAIQNRITCILRITLRGSPVSNPPKEIEILLHEPEIYQKIEQEAEGHAKDFCGRSMGSRELILLYGNCTIIWNNINKQRRPLRSHEEWGEVYKSIVEYWTSHTHEKLRLHIWRDYHQQPTIDGSFAEAKTNEIHDLMKHAWDLRRYIAHSDLEKIMSDHTIREIIMEDDCKGIKPDDKEMFIQQVQSQGRILLAICLRSDIKMRCLKHLLDSMRSDARLPFDEKDQCHPSCRGKFQTLLDAQGIYLAARFDDPGEHKGLHPSIVVPLHFCPRADGKNNMILKEADSSVNELQDPYSQEIAAKKKMAAECGSGAYSNVYCVKLDPNHHGLSKDLDTCFALKEFRDRGQKSSEDFRRELKILKDLRQFNHRYIVTHLATWTQVGRHYLLFPFAQCNLREYMRQARFGLSKKEDIIWLLDQVHGMADAVKHIHRFTQIIGLGPPVPSSSLAAPAAGERKTAWHHDLKPENILYFVDSCTARGMFRISDWGSGKVNEYRHTSSYHTRSPIGTVTYEPPEATSESGTSRPYDLWSLGCIYLELLIWAVFGPEAVESFSDDREDNRATNSQSGTFKDDAFWEKVGEEYVLRSSVIARMRLLDEALAKPRAPPFQELLRCVRRMLEIEANKRIKAFELSELLDQIYKTKKVELENDSETNLSLIPTDHHSPDGMTLGNSPLPGRSSDPAYAEHFNLSPSDMSPRTTRGQHSRNSSASELMPSNATRSRQSSNASTLSVRERRGSHSSANSPRATGGGT